MLLSRREFVAGVAVGTASILGAGVDAAGASKPHEETPPGALPGKHTVVPLSFNPAKLKGISEKLIRSHHENNYAGAVKNLNSVEEELARMTKSTPGYLVGGLKERELTFSNSKVLHEHYFGNLGGDGKLSGSIQALLSQNFGSAARWEEHFRATGASLAGGSGWVILDFRFPSGQLGTFWSGNHTQTAAFTQPLLVMDMYEHAYQMDYGAAAAKYIDAFFQNIQWDEVNRRLEAAQKATALLRG
jgi:Fe-Mn family superoxide dismutase